MTAHAPHAGVPSPAMLFGGIRQNGYVVPDIEAGVQYWVRYLGVAPWVIFEHVPVTNYTCDGVSYDLDMTIALAHVGDLQIELIEQHNDVPSLYREFLQQCPQGGLQHLGFWPDDMDAAIAEAEARGWVLGHGGQIGPQGRFRYYRTEESGGPLGVVLELAEVLGERRERFERWAETTRRWDGTGTPVTRRTV
jgi:catechol 2,3-dioxygenase-like lactoylglutathione lyase family enzyme